MPIKFYMTDEKYSAGSPFSFFYLIVSFSQFAVGLNVYTGGLKRMYLQLGWYKCTDVPTHMIYRCKPEEAVLKWNAAPLGSALNVCRRYAGPIVRDFLLVRTSVLWIKILCLLQIKHGTAGLFPSLQSTFIKWRSCWIRTRNKIISLVLRIQNTTLI